MLFIGTMIYSCGSPAAGPLYGTPVPEPYDTTHVYTDDVVSDTVRIANDSLEYEIIIIEPGYAYFLASMARPEGYYSQSYLENKNRFLVTDYNNRVRQPLQYDTSIYAQEINYDPQVDYGYEVNYKLYYYFVYLAHAYEQKFSVPTRI